MTKLPNRLGDARATSSVLDGLITAEEARRDYGVVVDAGGRLDVDATERARKA